MVASAAAVLNAGLGRRCTASALFDADGAQMPEPFPANRRRNADITFSIRPATSSSVPEASTVTMRSGHAAARSL